MTRIDSIRVTIFGESDSTGVTVNDSKLESESFLQTSEFQIDKPTSCALKEMSIFCFSDDQDWPKIFCFVCLVILCYISNNKVINNNDIFLQTHGPYHRRKSTKNG